MCLFGEEEDFGKINSLYVFKMRIPPLPKISIFPIIRTPFLASRKCAYYVLMYKLYKKITSKRKFLPEANFHFELTQYFVKVIFVVFTIELIEVVIHKRYKLKNNFSIEFQFHLQLASMVFLNLRTSGLGINKKKIIKK